MTTSTGNTSDDEPEGIGHTEIPEESAASESELSMSAQVEARESDGDDD